MAPRFDRLRDRVADRTATVVVVGQGYVGLSVASGAALSGMTVVGVDKDAERVQSLAAGDLVVPGVRETAFALAYDTGRLSFSTEPSSVADADVTIICVPTPLVDYRPDTSYIESAAQAIVPHIAPGTLVVLESTTYAGTTEDFLLPLLEQHGLRAGEDFLLAFSPERIDPGNSKFGIENTPRLVGGVTPASTEVAVHFYRQFIDDVHPISSARAAELAKLLENTFRMVNIALVNELATVCWQQQIDVWEVIDAASTKPFGFMSFYPGPGVGGHCIPLDPEYLAWRARQVTGRRFRMVELAQEINTEMPDYVGARVAEALNEHGKAVRGATILVLGVTYKADVGDIRESAAVQVLHRLRRRGGDVRYHDPFVDELDVEDVTLSRVTLSDEALHEADVVVVLTPHSQYDIATIVAKSRLIVDARNATRDVRTAGSSPSNVVVL